MYLSQATLSLSPSLSLSLYTHTHTHTHTTYTYNQTLVTICHSQHSLSQSSSSPAVSDTISALCSVTRCDVCLVKRLQYLLRYLYLLSCYPLCRNVIDTASQENGESLPDMFVIRLLILIRYIQYTLLDI